MKLSDCASNTYSQFGEDGMIAEVFRRIGGGGVCVEFGAADGLSCSNTACLWKDGWCAVLVEADADLYEELVDNTANAPDATPVHMTVAPSGDNSIDVLLAGLDLPAVDLMSIDVDGDDYAIWEAMLTRPRVVVIEYNQSVPPHVDLRQAQPGDRFGASAEALCQLGRAKGYELVGLSRCNLIFVDVSLYSAFYDVENWLDELFDYNGLTYVATDYDGRPVIVGTPPWGWHPETYLGETVGEPIQRLPIDVDKLWATYVRRLGSSDWVWVGSNLFNIVDLRPEAITEMRLEAYLGRKLVGIDLRHVPAHELELAEWIKPFAAEHGYRYRMDPGLITLIKE